MEQMMTTRFSQELNIDNWQKSRAEGLYNLHRILLNIMLVNAQDVFPLNYQARDYDLHEITSVSRLLNHPAISGFVIITTEGDVLLEYYHSGYDRYTTFSDQSSTKSMGYILLNQAIRNGVISLEDNVDKYIPEIGPGFKGRTIDDVAAMAVHHYISELDAYTGDPEALELFNRDERVIGLQRNDERETLVQFIRDIKAGGKDGSNEWKGKIANYTTANTNVLGLAIERAMQKPLAGKIRHLLHKVGGENPMYMGTDFDGIPMIGASMLSSTVDFARYGRLLIEYKDQALADMEAAQSDGQVVPVDLTHIESRYYKSMISNEFGLGHSGWGGQLIWADPESGTIIAINSLLASTLPAPFDHFEKLYTAAYDIVKHTRAKPKE